MPYLAGPQELPFHPPICKTASGTLQQLLQQAEQASCAIKNISVPDLAVSPEILDWNSPNWTFRKGVPLSRTLPTLHPSWGGAGKSGHHPPRCKGPARPRRVFWKAQRGALNPFLLLQEVWRPPLGLTQLWFCKCSAPLEAVRVQLQLKLQAQWAQLRQPRFSLPFPGDLWVFATHCTPKICRAHPLTHLQVWGSRAGVETRRASH